MPEKENCLKCFCGCTKFKVYIEEPEIVLECVNCGRLDSYVLDEVELTERLEAEEKEDDTNS